jgi:hypothetical protein
MAIRHAHEGSAIALLHPPASCFVRLRCGAGLLLLIGSAVTASAQTPAGALAEWELHGRVEGLARPDTVCQDFLQAMGRKPAELEYVGCTQDDDSYIQPMEARYRVSGASAAKIEAYLQQTFGMPPLKYVCCGWSNGAPYVWREQPGSVKYQIGMGVESLHHPRTQWSAIPYFMVTVAVNRKGP